jgi:hypothetical protein
VVGAVVGPGWRPQGKGRQHSERHHGRDATEHRDPLSLWMALVTAAVVLLAHAGLIGLAADGLGEAAPVEAAGLAMDSDASAETLSLPTELKASVTQETNRFRATTAAKTGRVQRQLEPDVS